MDPGLEQAGQSKVDDAQDLKGSLGSIVLYCQRGNEGISPKSYDFQELECYLFGIASHKATKILLLLLHL